MRFMSRSTQATNTITLPDSPDNVLQLADGGLPQRVESVLRGKKTRLGRKKSEKKTGGKDSFEHVQSQEQQSLGTLLRAQEALLDTQQSLLDNMSRPRGGMSVWPNVERENRSYDQLLHAGVYQPSRPPGIPPRKTSSNAVNQHYDPTKQPSYVSQQTSASAVRDMGLRKGSPFLHETSSDPTLAKRPLKSAMKKKHPDELLRMRTNSSDNTSPKDTRKPRRLDLAQFFPQPRAHAAHLLSPERLSRSPSALTEASDFFPQETVQVKLKRPAANARFETYKNFKAPSTDSVSTTRAKVFEPDIYDQAKTNVRRPPKGIQNWFDGFDISSDEELGPETEPQELPGIEPLPSTFSPWVKPDNEQPTLNRKASKDPVEDNLLAIEAAKERMQERMRMVSQRKGSADSVTLASVFSSEAPSRKPPSRLATSRLASESVLSLSDSDGGERAGLPDIRDSVEDASVIVANAAAVQIEKPLPAPPKRLQSQRSIPRESFPRQSTSTMQTSGSIPIRLTGSIPLPEMPAVATAQRTTQTSCADPTLQALRKLTGQRDSSSQASRSRRTTKASAQDYAESAATGETTSSMPTDAAHMMAVTEEEMALLEMMRRKRAAMQKNSFTEGYQLALQREQEHLARRRESAQQTASKILRLKEERTKSQRGSKAVDSMDVRAALDEQQRRKYSEIRKEDVDRALKLERFLASQDMPMVDAFPEPPSLEQSVESRRAPQKFDLLLPDTYSPTPPKHPDDLTPVSAGGSSPLPGEEDIDDHHHKLRQFLASSASEGTSVLFPTPPSIRSRVEARREQRRSIVSPSPVVEEQEIPELPPRNPHRPSPPAKERREWLSTSQRQSPDIDFGPPSKSSTVQSLPPKSVSPAPHQYFLSPNLDFAPLDFPPSQTAASPSLSTSRASPLTPTFAVATPSDRPTVEGAFSSDNERSVRTRTYTPDTDLTSLSASAFGTTPRSMSRKQYGSNAASRKDPPRLDTVLGDGLKARGSVASFTSAGEDVLAAWAELGGGTEALASRRRVR